MLSLAYHTYMINVNISMVFSCCVYSRSMYFTTENKLSFQYTIKVNELCSCIIIADSVLSRFNSEKVNHVAVRGARPQDLNSVSFFGKCDLHRYRAIIIMLGGNSFADWRNRTAETPLDVSSCLMYSILYVCDIYICSQHIGQYIAKTHIFVAAAYLPCIWCT